MKTNLADGILLSGGLDTSIIAVIASKFKSLKAVTIAFQNAPAPDVEYAVLISKQLGLQHTNHYFTESELYAALPVVIKATKSFDPMEIRNSVVIYLGLKIAKENGIHTIFTGDGADELFAGYSYLFGLEKRKLDMELKKLSEVMTFSSVPLATELGLEAVLPFLEPHVKNFALHLDSHYKIREENGQLYGKWILRKTYERLLPKAIVWRVKTPIEVGAGTTILPTFFNQKLSDSAFQEKRERYQIEDHVTIRDKEQLFYYEIYRSLLKIPPPLTVGDKTCPYCQSPLSKKATYCRICGAYPV